MASVEVEVVVVLLESDEVDVGLDPVVAEAVLVVLVAAAVLVVLDELVVVLSALCDACAWVRGRVQVGHRVMGDANVGGRDTLFKAVAGKYDLACSTWFPGRDSAEDQLSQLDVSHFHGVSSRIRGVELLHVNGLMKGQP